jgi:hypothetical protein
MQLAHTGYAVMIEAGLSHQAGDLSPRVEKDAAIAQSQPCFPDGRSPRPESRERNDGLVCRDLSHLF